MSWNYRVIKHVTGIDSYFAIHEVYYDEHGKIEAWTEDPIELVADSKAELIEDLRCIMSDIRQPTLRESVLAKLLKGKEASQTKRRISSNKLNSKKTKNQVNKIT